MERLTEYHAGVAVIKDKNRLSEAMGILAEYEDKEERKQKTEKSNPEFPILTNNKKRNEFLDGFRDWQIWFEVPEKDEIYYRFNLPDGSSIVICEYKTYCEWKKKYANEDPETISTREYLLKPGYHYMNDCKVSRSVLVDYLKEIRKKDMEM